MNPIRPGTRKFVDLSSGLYQTRGSNRIGLDASFPDNAARIRALSCATNPSAYPARWSPSRRRRRRPGAAPWPFAPPRSPEHRPRDDEDGLGLPARQDRAGVGSRRQAAGVVEIGRVHERVDEIAARPGEAQVLDDELHVAHVEVQRVAVQEQHERRDAEEHHQAERIAPRLTQLLSGNRERFSHAAPSLARETVSRSTVCMKTSSRDGTIRSTVAGPLPPRASSSSVRRRPSAASATTT